MVTIIRQSLDGFSLGALKQTVDREYNRNRAYELRFEISAGGFGSSTILTCTVMSAQSGVVVSNIEGLDALERDGYAVHVDGRTYPGCWYLPPVIPWEDWEALRHDARFWIQACPADAYVKPGQLGRTIGLRILSDKRVGHIRQVKESHSWPRRLYFHVVKVNGVEQVLAAIDMRGGGHPKTPKHFCFLHMEAQAFEAYMGGLSGSDFGRCVFRTALAHPDNTSYHDTWKDALLQFREAVPDILR